MNPSPEVPPWDLTSDEPVEKRLQAAGIVVADHDMALAGVRALLRYIGDDPTREGIQETPERVVRAYAELCAKPGDPAVLLSKQFDVHSDSVVAVGPIAFVSICEHHLLPFEGTAWVAYKPNGSVVGLSKLARVVKHFAARPQVQERLTEQITAAINEHVDTDGAACLIRSSHSCMTLRGVQATGAKMVTSSLTGLFREDPAARAEFLSLAHD